MAVFNPARRPFAVRGWMGVTIAVSALAVAAWLGWPADSEGEARADSSGRRNTAGHVAGEPIHGVAPAGTPDASPDRGADVAQPSSESIVPPSRVEFGEPRELTITVRGSSSGPIAGATIDVVRRMGVAPGPLEELDPDRVTRSLSRRHATTDASGSAVVSIPPGEHIVVVRRPGFETGLRQVGAGPVDGNPIVVQVDATTGIHGVVIDAATRTPIAGVRLLAIPWDASRRDPTDAVEDIDRILAARAAFSGADGRFALDHSRNVQHVLWCFVEDVPPILLDNVSPLQSDVIVRVGGTASVAGIVVDADGAAVAGAHVDCAAQGEWPLVTAGETRTDAEGRFRLSELPTGLVAFRVTAEGFGVVKSFQTLPLDADDPIEIALAPEAPFRGRVVDQLGRPLAGALVRVHDRDQNLEPSRMETEEDGTFWSINVPASHRLEIWISRRGTFTQKYFGWKAPCEDAEFVLPLALALRGSVVDADDRPVPSFEIARRFDTMAFDSELAELQLPWTRFQAEDGRFAILVAPGGGTITVRAAGFESATLPYHDRGPGEELEPITVALAAGQAVSGRVLGTDGSPIAGASVRLAEQTRFGEPVTCEGLGATTTDRAGGFRLAQAGSTPFDLLIQAAGRGRLLLRDQRVEDFPRDLILEPPGAIEGIAAMPWRSPETTALVLVRPLGTHVTDAMRPDVFGRFRFDGLGRGAHVVELGDGWAQAERGSNQMQSTVVDVVPGETTWVELESGGAGCEVEGSVRCAAASALPDRFEVSLLQEMDGELRVRALTPTDGSGWFCFGRVKPGRYRARVRSRAAGDVVGAERELRIAEGVERVSLDFDVVAQGIAGRVRDSTGAPVQAQVTLLDPRAGEVVARSSTDREGVYRILTRADTALLWLRSRGFAEAWETGVDLAAGANAPPLDHVLAVEARLLVDVVDDRGAGVVGATVEVDVRGRPGVLPALAQSSDAGGRCTFGQLRRGALSLAARRAGHVPSASTPVLVAEGESRRVTLQLVRCGSIEIHATAVHGRPAAGAELLVQPTAAEPAIEPRRVVADTGGKAVVADLPPGSYAVSAPPGVPTPLEVRPGGTVRCEIRIEGS